MKDAIWGVPCLYGYGFLSRLYSASLCQEVRLLLSLRQSGGLHGVSQSYVQWCTNSDDRKYGKLMFDIKEASSTQVDHEAKLWVSRCGYSVVHI